MFSKSSSRVGRRVRLSAFTLAEVLVAMGIGVAMLGAVMLSSIELYKNISAGADYRNIHKNARDSLAYLSRDIRSCSNVYSFATDNLALDIVNSSGGISRVQYQLVNQNLTRTETTPPSGGVSTQKTLSDNITSVDFERWTKPGTPATSSANTYEIRVFLTMTNSSPFRSASDLLQTRVCLRNK